MTTRKVFASHAARGKTSSAGQYQRVRPNCTKAIKLPATSIACNTFSPAQAAVTATGKFCTMICVPSRVTARPSAWKKCPADHAADNRNHQPSEGKSSASHGNASSRKTNSRRSLFVCVGEIFPDSHDHSAIVQASASSNATSSASPKIKNTKAEMSNLKLMASAFFCQLRHGSPSQRKTAGAASSGNTSSDDVIHVRSRSQMNAAIASKLPSQS